MFRVNPSEDLDLKGFKLIVPSIAVGNVPQLSTDLLIHSLGTKLVARLDSTLLYPFASPVDHLAGEPVDKLDVSTGLELYCNFDKKVAIIQQRCPVLPGFSKNFIDYLVTFIKDSEFDSIFILDANDNLREDINNDKPMELYSNALTESFQSLQMTISRDKLTSFTPFVQTFIKELKGFNVFALVIFVYEGDNFYDAKVISQETIDLLEISIDQWKTPISWNGAYGDKPIPIGLDEGLYG